MPLRHLMNKKLRSISVKFLLDTHTLLWWWVSSDKLSENAYQIIKNPNNMIFMSSASIWELATKCRKGKLPEAEKVLEHLDILIEQSGFEMLAIDYKHAKRSGELPQNHADPFDRMLVAQAQIENLILISKDETLKAFDFHLFW